MTNKIETTTDMPFLSSFTNRFSANKAAKLTDKPKKVSTAPYIVVNAKAHRIQFNKRVCEATNIKDGWYITFFFNKEKKVIGWRVRPSISDALTIEEKAKWIKVHFANTSKGKASWWMITSKTLFQNFKLLKSEWKGSKKFTPKRFVDKYNTEYFFVDLNEPIEAVDVSSNGNSAQAFQEIQGDFFGQ